MNIAHCTLNKHTYTAQEFSQLDPGTLELNRHWLVCAKEECGGKAWYRRPTHITEHFAASHQPDCPVKSDDRGEIEAPLPGGFDSTRRGVGFELILQAQGGSAGTMVRDNTDSQKSPGSARRHTPSGEVASSPHRYQLETMLDLIIARPDIARSTEPLSIGNLKTTCRAFFARLRALTDGDVGRFGGFYGRIRSFHDGKAHGWLNASGTNTAVRVSKDARAKINEVRSGLAGAEVLALGTVHQGPNGLEVYVTRAADIVIAGNQRGKSTATRSQSRAGRYRRPTRKVVT